MEHHEHILRIIAEQEKRYLQMFADSRQAVDKAEAALTARLETMNEIRQQLNDQALTFMPRQEAEQRFKTVEEWKATQTGYFQRETKAKDFNLWVVSTIISLAIAVAAIAESAYLIATRH